MQPAGDGETLRVYKRIRPGDEVVLLWELTEAFVGDQDKWHLASMKILAHQTDDYEYRVCRI